MKLWKHPLEEARLLGGGKARFDEVRRVLPHLSKGCSVCRSAVRSGWRGDLTDDLLTNAIDGAVSRAVGLGAEVEKERRIADDLISELDGHTLGRATTLVTNSLRFQRRSVCEGLIARSISARHDDPAVTLRYAELAAVVADRLADPWPEDVQAAAWAEVGNARRLCGDLLASEAAFQRAKERLDLGGGDPQLKAEYLLMLAVLRVYQRRLMEAEELNQRAKRIYERLHDRHGVARCLFQIGKVQGKAGNPAAGLLSIWAGLRTLGPDPEPRLVFPAIHNLIILIEEVGASQAAAGLLEAARPLYEVLAGELDLARLDWLRAKVQTSLGMLDDAGFLLEGLRERFAEHKLVYEVALVSLDLADIYSRQHRNLESRVLLHESIPTFKNLGVTREALAAAAMLRQTPAQGTREGAEQGDQPS